MIRARCFCRRFFPAARRLCWPKRAWFVLVAVALLLAATRPAAAQAELPLVAPAPSAVDSAPTTTRPVSQAVPEEAEDSPRALLALLGVERSHLAGFEDGTPLGPEEVEFLVRMLYAAGRFHWEDFHRWQQPLDEHWQELVADPEKHRGEVYQLQGRLLSVRRHEVPAELARRINIPHYYVCQVRTHGQERELTLVVRDVPAPWQKKPPAGDRVAARGFFVKLQSTDRKDPRPVFVVPHVAWYPDTFLGRLGVDFAAWSRARARGPFTPADRHPFYQLLRGVGELSWQELQAQVTPGEKIAQQNPRFAKFRDSPQELKAPAFWILTLLAQPQRFRGTVVSLQGTARRAIRIEVTDPEIRTLYRIRHYWEVEVFVDPGPRIQVFGETVTYYPVVVCVSHLPRGFPEGEDLHEPVALEGVFFKSWSYYSALGIKHRPEAFLKAVDQDGDGRASLAEVARYYRLSPNEPRLRQRFHRADRNRSRFLEREELQWLLGMQEAPLLVAPTLRWIREQPATSPSTVGLVGGLLLLLGLVVLGVVLWRTHRSDDQLAETVRRRVIEHQPEFPEPDASPTPRPEEPEKPTSPPNEPDSGP